jgi:hypothetical protein
MIIKFEVNGAWQIFDNVDSLMYRKLGSFNGKLAIKDDEQVEFIDYTKTMNSVCSNDTGFPGRVLLTFMNNKQLANFQAVAFSPIYLMNNNGRTIEIIGG